LLTVQQQASKNLIIKQMNLAVGGSTQVSNISPGLNRLIAVALVDPQFKQLLLTCPNLAVKKDYNLESLRLTSQDIELALEVKTDRLVDFATQLATEAK
jgi:hypothetical protein